MRQSEIWVCSTEGRQQRGLENNQERACLSAKKEKDIWRDDDVFEECERGMEWVKMMLQGTGSISNTTKVLHPYESKLNPNASNNCQIE